MASAALSALIEYSIIKEKSNLLCSFISLIKLHFKHINFTFRLLSIKRNARIA